MDKLPIMDNAQISHSLVALETRLRRLEFHLTGHFGSTLDSPPTTKEDQTARARITRLEQGLDDLATKSQTVRQLLHLRMSRNVALHRAR